MMTTDLITFFHPDGSTGKDWVFSPQLGDTAAAEVWVFDRGGKADFSRFASMKVSSEEEFKRMTDEINALIQQSGGIYFHAYDHNGVIRGKMVRVESSGYAPPKRMLRLSPSGRTGFEDITGRTDFSPGDHLVVPVSAAAEQRLQAFYNDLEGFPSDLQSLIFNVIRRPSLEWRIHRLERTVSGLPPATQAAQQKEQARRGDFLDKLYDAVMWKIPIGPAIAALLVLFISLVTYYEFFAQGGQAVAAEKTEEATEPETSASLAKNVVDPTEDVRQEDTEAQSLEESLNDLYVVLKASQNSDLKKLYENHFKDPGKNPATAGWGMAKLQALQLGLIKPNDQILDISDNPTAVSTLYEQKALPAIKRNKGSLSLLAWSCCQSFGGAMLPKTASHPALPLGENLKCDELEDDETLSGLTALTDWVKQKSEGS